MQGAAGPCARVRARAFACVCAMGVSSCGVVCACVCIWWCAGAGAGGAPWAGQSLLLLLRLVRVARGYRRAGQAHKGGHRGAGAHMATRGQGQGRASFACCSVLKGCGCLAERGGVGRGRRQRVAGARGRYTGPTSPCPPFLTPPRLPRRVVLYQGYAGRAVVFSQVYMCVQLREGAWVAIVRTCAPPASAAPPFWALWFAPPGGGGSAPSGQRVLLHAAGLWLPSHTL